MLRSRRLLVLALASAALLGLLAPALASARAHVTVALAPRDPEALAGYAAAVTDPASPLFRHYLGVGQFARRFGASAAAIARIRAALTAHHLAAGRLSPNGLSLSVTAAAPGGFSAALAHAAAGRAGAAPWEFASAALGDAAARLVQGIIGQGAPIPGARVIVRSPRRGSLSDLAHAMTAHVATAHVATAGAGPEPCPVARSIAAGTGGFTADRIAAAYGLSGYYAAGDHGEHVTIALYELEPFSAADVAAYQSCYGTGARVTTVAIDGGAGGGSGSGEAAMDVETLIGLAPEASIRVYEAPPTGAGAYDEYSRLVSDDSAQVISTSWGLCEALAGSAAPATENTLFQEAAVQGQSVLASSGDMGSDDCGTHQPSVDDPASQPWVTSVGATSVQPTGDVVWNDSLGATGGGVSRLWRRPGYQNGFAPAQGDVACGSAGTACRTLPDLSLDGDPETGYVAFYRGAWRIVGGTSVAAPTVAAMTALADASPSCGGHSLGFLNPGLYRAASGNYAANFHDVTAGNNGFDAVTGFVAGPGYDLASGLGTPAAPLGQALCQGEIALRAPGAQTGVAGRSASLRLTATAAPGDRIAYAASGLPSGLKVRRATGRISGTLRAAGRWVVTVTATSSGGGAATEVFVWTVRRGARRLRR